MGERLSPSSAGENISGKRRSCVFCGRFGQRDKLIIASIVAATTFHATSLSLPEDRQGIALRRFTRNYFSVSCFWRLRSHGAFCPWPLCPPLSPWPDR